MPDRATLRANRDAFWTAYREGRISELADLATADTELAESALFRTIDAMLFDGREEEIVQLRALSTTAKHMSRVLWRLIALHFEGDENAVRMLRDLPVSHTRAAGLNIAGPVWAAFLSAPRLTRGEATGSGPTIMQFWDKEVVPEDVAGAIAQWRAISGGNHVLFDQVAAQDFLRDHFGTNAAATLAACPHPAIMSDYFRLGWLAAEGGLYVDADSILRPSMKEIWPQMIDKTCLWVRTHVPHAAISNGIMAAKKGSSLMHRAFEEAGLRLASGETENVVGTAGPILIRNIVSQMECERSLEPIDVMTTSFVRRLIYRDLHAEYKQGTGHWAAWQKAQRAGKTKDGPPSH
ncbi:MAG: glycosyltransferase [Pseudomonadota bacterium]